MRTLKLMWVVMLWGVVATWPGQWGVSVAQAEEDLVVMDDILSDGDDLVHFVVVQGAIGDYVFYADGQPWSLLVMLNQGGEYVELEFAFYGGPEVLKETDDPGEVAGQDGDWLAGAFGVDFVFPFPSQVTEIGHAHDGEGVHCMLYDAHLIGKCFELNWLKVCYVHLEWENGDRRLVIDVFWKDDNGKWTHVWRGDTGRVPPVESVSTTDSGLDTMAELSAVVAKINDDLSNRFTPEEQHLLDALWDEFWVVVEGLLAQEVGRAQNDVEEKAAVPAHGETP